MTTTGNTLTAAIEAVVDEGGAVKLVGEVICWSMRGAKSLSAVRAALVAAGFDGRKMAPDFKHVNVFARVVEKLEQGGRIVKRIRNEDDFAHYQFNQAKAVQAAEDESAAEGAPAVEYPFEDIITLGKKSGEVTCKSDDFKAHLMGEMARHRELRTASDITGIVQRLFDVYGKENNDADLFAIRPGGAVYFVLAKHTPFLDKVAQFVTEMGGQFMRFPIPVGTAAGNLSVKETVENGLMSLIHEFDMTVKSLNSAAKKGTLEKTAKRVEMLREKIECYNVYLGSARESLMLQVAESDKKLKEKVRELAFAAAGEEDDEDEDGAGEEEGAGEPALAV